MLSNEGNEKGEKKNNNWSNQQKSNFFFCTLLCRCFARLQRETSRNLLIIRFVQEMSYVFLFIFFYCRSFSPWWALPFLIFPQPLQNFHVVFPTKKCLLCFLSLVGLCWSVAYFLLFSVSLFSVFQICGHDNLSFILQTTRPIQKQFRRY